MFLFTFMPLSPMGCCLYKLNKRKQTEDVSNAFDWLNMSHGAKNDNFKDHNITRNVVLNWTSAKLWLWNLCSSYLNSMSCSYSV
jgi:hypothetical protein